MKNYQRILFPAVLAVCIITGCKNEKDPVHNEEYNEVKVNPAFIRNPPIAQNVKVSLFNEKTRSGNVLFEATLPKEKIKSPLHAIMITEKNKIVLHDDGINGDKKKDDGIYSIVLSENIEHLKVYLKAKDDSLAILAGSKSPLHHFEGRIMVSDSKGILLKHEFDFVKGIPLTPVITPIPASLITETLKRSSLMVTDSAVVNDFARTYNPCDSLLGTRGGAWTFGHLISEMANTAVTDTTPEDFLLSWLNTWMTEQIVNGDTIAARTNISNIINDWRFLSGGVLDVNNAPFKLLAIVNRFDLKETTGYGGGNAGEGRFVFCATDRFCNNQRFLVIFEYGVNKTTCTDIHAYAQQWRDLEFIKLTSGIEAYKTALQVITDQFVLAGTNPSKPNQSSLNQIRTNEVDLGLPWELREFNIDSATMLLKNVTTKREPQTPFNRLGLASDIDKVNAFGKFVNDNYEDAIADKLDVPDSIDTGSGLVPFLGGKALTMNAVRYHWDAALAGPDRIDNDTARMHISLNTCSGCHGGEDSTFFFTHVGLPTAASAPEANLSQFLTGELPYSDDEFPVTDRANRTPPDKHVWGFNDLQRRSEFLLDFLTTDCPSLFPFPPASSTSFTIKMPVSIYLTKILTTSPLTMTH